MPILCEGSNYLVYDGKIYCNEAGTKNVAVIDIASLNFVARIPFDDVEGKEASFRNQCPYGSYYYSDFDIEADEFGLWVIWGRRREACQFALSKIYPTNNTIEQTWWIPASKTGTGNAFMKCGSLHVIASYNSNPSFIRYIYSTSTGVLTEYTSSNGIVWNNHHGYLSHAHYNKKEGAVYIWDNGRQSKKTLPVTAHFASVDPDGNPATDDEIVTFSISQVQLSKTFARIFLVTPSYDVRECEATTITANGEVSLILHVSNNSPQGCNLQRNADNSVDVAIVAAQSLVALRGDDYKFSFTVDLNNPTTQEILVQGIDASGDLTSQDASAREETVSLSVLKKDSSNSGIFIDSRALVQLGDKLKLKLVLQKTGTTRQLRGISCKATSVDSGQELNLIADSCATTDSGLSIDTGFGFDITENNVTFTTKTNAFAAFKFTTQSEELLLQCAVVFCNGLDENTRCHSNNCVHNNRRRRQADDDTTSVVTTITVGDRVRVISRTNYTAQPQEQTCSGSFGGITCYIIVGVLASLLLLAVVVSAILSFFMMSRKSAKMASHSSNDSKMYN